MARRADALQVLRAELGQRATSYPCDLTDGEAVDLGEVAFLLAPRLSDAGMNRFHRYQPDSAAARGEVSGARTG